MHKLRLLGAGLVIVTGAAGLVAYRHSDASAAPSYRFASVQRGDLESTVSSTGTLSADTTVQVGTQVSGRVTDIYVDFNDRVRKGQLVARIDPTLARQAVADAQAGVARAQATLDETSGDYEREKKMFDQKVVTLSEFATARSGFEVAKANLTSAEVALAKAKQDLGYTSIHAPISGIVVERNVNVGQTVAASFSAPQLFLIANDLSNMQILASVDESDIGLIKAGQRVRFTVQAYPDREFTGVVKQVRLQSATQDNVVNYTVVVSVKNPDGALLPGMTAVVNFLTGSARQVLTVPNAALRFRPTPEMLARLEGTDTAARDAAYSAAKELGARPGGVGPPERRRAQRGPHAFHDVRSAILWYIDRGHLRATRVRTGLTDGQRTEVQSSALIPGQSVIVGLALNDAPDAATSSPLEQQRGPARGPVRF